MPWSHRVFACAATAICLTGCFQQTPPSADSLIEQIASAQKTYAAEMPARQTYDATTLLTDEDIRQITGHKVLKKEPGPAMGIFPNGCRWVLEGDQSGINWELVLGAMSPGGRKYYDTFLTINGDPTVSCLGDAAIQQSPGTFTAVKGDVLISINHVEFPARPEVTRKLVEIIFSRLP